jgi:transcription elongation factor GreA
VPATHPLSLRPLVALRAGRTPAVAVGGGAIGRVWDATDVSPAGIAAWRGVGRAWDNPEMSTSNETGEPITEEGLAALRAEIGELETVARRDIAARILEARGHGDLKENAEYHAAKEDQGHLETRILRLRQRMRNAVVVESIPTDGSTMAFARQAEIRDLNTDEVHRWTIVGAAEADRSAGKLSAESPVAQALLDHAVGETVELQTPRGVRRLKIERLV